MWAKELIEGAATSWYGSVRIVHACEEAEAEVDIAATPLVYGYHPHAMIPAAAVWFPMLPKFSERFKDVRPVTLAASVIFKAPVVREIAAWLGVRSVQRDVFRSALREERAVVICPGGQREMTEHFGGPGRTPSRYARATVDSFASPSKSARASCPWCASARAVRGETF